MVVWNPKLWRIALRLQARYATVDRNGHDCGLPELDWLALRRQTGRLAVAEVRGWSAAIEHARAALILDLERLGYCLRDSIEQLRTAGRAARPTIRTLYEELLATESEFEGLEVSDGLLGVTTGPIILEDVFLGRFRIEFDLDHLGSESPYAIIALEPNPASSCSDTTHPHVHNERLCPGEGRGAINAALAEGRLFDFFTIVDRILHSYGAGSAYVELARWYGISCHDCDCAMDEDETCCCRSCERTLCGECLTECSRCGDGYCSDCVDRCAQCEERTCSGCLTECPHCRRQVCGGCLDERVCTSCLEELENEDEPTEEAGEALASPTKSAI